MHAKVLVSHLFETKLIKGIFQIDNSTNPEKLVCNACKKWPNAHSSSLGFSLIGGSTYSVWLSGTKKPVEKWFSNMKQKIAQHLIRQIHIRDL